MIDDEIATLIGRPPTSGNVGEMVAAAIFRINLEQSAATAGYDGRFSAEPRPGSTVNVKTYSEQTTLLDISPHPCDLYLVLMGPPRAKAERGRSLPFRVASVFLFEMPALLATLKEAGVRSGVATSVRTAIWQAAQIYPQTATSPLQLSDAQVRQLELFA